ncbi:hypothetical protein Taro_033779 [Colocasia esculenta]|uniref:CCHC-type domain-containing protein n=1 Tax=Colocasia esculenta TaxID=4460 RepID=A0A843W5P6_COLES|nr:hypothetical protein [Colocasia esculenta]
MVKKAQLLEDATDFTDRIKGKFVKKEMTFGQSSAMPNNGKKRPFNITEGPNQERNPKVIIPNTQTKSNCKHCDKPGHTADECWRKVVNVLFHPRSMPRCCFHNVFDSAGSAGVVFGLTRVVVEAFLYFCYFLVLCSRCFLLYYFVEKFCFHLLEFLLLWLVRDWLSLLSLVREAHPLLSLGRDSLSQEFIAGRSWWRFVAPCIASSSVPSCCFCNVFDSACSEGVVFGLTRVVVEVFLCFRCFVRTLL